MPNSPHRTATRAEIENTLRCGPPRAVPLFLPAIYEHKAWFIQSTPSAFSRDGDLLTRALLAEYEAIGPDALAIGVDVYNLEAESVGCTVSFYEGDDTSIQASNRATTSSTSATISRKLLNPILSRTDACR